MKILFLHPNAWTGEYAILRHLVGQGHQVCVLESDGNLDSARSAKGFFKKPGDAIPSLIYNPHRGPEKLLTWPVDTLIKRLGYRGNLGHRMWMILAAARYFDPDVVISSEGAGFAPAAALLKRARMLRPRLVVGFIGGDILDCEDADCGTRRTRAINWLFKQVRCYADVLRPVSPLLRDVLLRDGASAEKIRICPSHLVADDAVIESVRSQRSSISQRIRQRYGIPESAPVIISLSGNDKGKGVHVLARAWSTILSRFPDAHWLLAGPRSNWVEQVVLPQLESSGAEASVHLTGRLNGIEVFEHLAAADWNVNPSLCEGLNMVTVEAAAVGTPTVSSDGAGIAVWLSAAGAGVVVPAGDEKALSESLAATLGDNGIRKQMAANGLLMSERFRLDAVATELLAIMTSHPN